MPWTRITWLLWPRSWPAITHPDHGFPLGAGAPAHADPGLPVRGAATTAADRAARPGFRPFLIGLVHGVAGSGALMLLVAASIPDRSTGFLYVVLFGVGSVGGMLLMSALLSIPMTQAARRSSRLFDIAQAAAAAASLIVAAGIALR